MHSLVLIAACALAAGFFAGSESGAYRLNRIRLRREAGAGSRRARLLQGLVSDMERFVCMTLVTTNIAYYLAILFCTRLLRASFRSELAAEFVGMLVLAPVLLVVSEILPKSVFQGRPNLLLMWTAPVLWLSDKVFWPVVKLLRGVTALWRRLLGGRGDPHGPAVTREYLNFFLAEGTREGIITSQQNLMARNIMQLGSRPVRKVMIPLARVRMIPHDATDAEIRSVIPRHNHARLPVYDGKRSRVIGILLTLDYLCNGRKRSLGELLRTPSFLHANLPLDEAFQQLQRAGQTMGIVVDTRGRAVGMVTTGDLLQEIFRSLDAA